MGFPSEVYFVILWIDGFVSDDLAVISLMKDEGCAEVRLAFSKLVLSLIFTFDRVAWDRSAWARSAWARSVWARLVA